MFQIIEKGNIWFFDKININNFNYDFSEDKQSN